MTYMYGIAPHDNELYHHGVKGMKWGVRRYRNSDGTLTPEGKKRYSNRGSPLPKYQQRFYLAKKGFVTEKQLAYKGQKQLRKLEKKGRADDPLSIHNKARNRAAVYGGIKGSINIIRGRHKLEKLERKGFFDDPLKPEAIKKGYKRLYSAPVQAALAVPYAHSRYKFEQDAIATAKARAARHERPVRRGEYYLESAAKFFIPAHYHPFKVPTFTRPRRR